MGLLTQPFSDVWSHRIQSETKAMAQHMFMHFGREGELLGWPRRAPDTAPVRECLSLSSSAPDLPSTRAAPKARGQHDPSLVATTLGTRRWPGSYTLGYAHSRIGGTVDHSKLEPPSRTETARSSRALRSPGEHERSTAGGRRSHSGSALHMDCVRSRPASHASRTSALSAASRMLLRQEVEQAVQSAVSEALSSPKGRS